MGRTIPLFLLRASSILIAGMLLFAVFGHAHAENLDGYGLKTPDAADAADAGYGLKPLPGTPAAANASYNAAPVSGGYNAPSGSGYTPAPAGPVSSSYAPGAQPQYAAATQTQAPQQSGAFGYRPGDGSPSYTAPTYPSYPAMPSPTMPATPQSNGYYSTLNYQAPQQQQASYGYRSGDGTPGYGGGMSGAGFLPTYLLGPGDKIKLVVYGETDLSGDFTIDGNGNVNLPLIGQVRGAGYTAQQLGQVVGSALSQGYLKAPRVSIEISTYRPFYIIGAVNRPGEYPYVNNMNAMNAIALAGGFTTSAVESTIYVRREGSNEEVALPTDRTTQIYPGDVIRVHNTIFYDAMSWLSPLSAPASVAAAAAVH